MELICIMDFDKDGRIDRHEADLRHSFRWTMELEETEQRRLLKGNLKAQNVYIELKELKGEKQLWPFLLGTKKQELDIHLLEESDRILIELKKLTPVMGIKRRDVYHEEETNFLCNLSGLKKEGRGRLLIYKGGSSNISGDLFHSTDLFPMNVSVTLGTCDVKDGMEKAECSLKVTT